MVAVSPSAVCVEGEDTEGGMSSLRSPAEKMADTVFAALIAAASVEDWGGFLRQSPVMYTPSKGLFGNDEDGR